MRSYVLARILTLAPNQNLKSYVLAGILTLTPNRNLIIKLKSLGYFNFSTTAPKCLNAKIIKHKFT